MIVYLLAAAIMHPVHATLSELEWNQATKRLEIAIRLDSQDEQWLRKRYGKNQKESDWVIWYVRQRVRVSEVPENIDLDESRYYWIGRQEDGAHVWWYFEIDSPGSDPPTWIEQRMLLDREDSYIHRVLILNTDPKRSLTLTKKQPRGSLR